MVDVEYMPKKCFSTSFFYAFENFALIRKRFLPNLLYVFSFLPLAQMRSAKLPNAFLRTVPLCSAFT